MVLGFYNYVVDLVVNYPSFTISPPKVEAPPQIRVIITACPTISELDKSAWYVGIKIINIYTNHTKMETTKIVVPMFFSKPIVKLGI